MKAGQGFLCDALEVFSRELKLGRLVIVLGRCYSIERRSDLFLCNVGEFDIGWLLIGVIIHHEYNLGGERPHFVGSGEPCLWEACGIESEGPQVIEFRIEPLSCGQHDNIFDLCRAEVGREVSSWRLAFSVAVKDG